METLAFVEELGRNGEVVRRHALETLPARIGRGYDADVMLDDPHVAANHLEIRSAADGRMEAVDLGSLNGTCRVGSNVRIGTTPIHGDDVFRIGRTQVRIRLPGHAVQPEEPLQQRSWDRHPGVFATAVVLLAGMMVWAGFTTTYGTDASGIVVVPALMTICILVWAGTWSLVCRTLHGSANFWAHGIVAFLGYAGLLIVDTVNDYLEFALDLHGFGPVWMCLSAAVLAGVLYRHLRLTARSSPRVLGAISIVVVAVLIGGIEGYQSVRDSNKPGLQAYDRSVKPSDFLFASGIAPDQFVSLTEKLKTKADKDAGDLAR